MTFRFVTTVATAFVLGLGAIAAQAMPAPDDNMDSWPQKLKEVANPVDSSRVADPGQLQIRNPGRVLVDPEPQPWKIRPQGIRNGF